MLTIVRSGSFLHDADLASSIKDLYQLNATDALEDAEPEEDA